MKIQFFLIQARVGKDSQKAVKNYFKLNLCHSLFLHYLDRINFYRSVEIKGISFKSFYELYGSEQNAQLFCCDLGPKAKNLTSEALAQQIKNLENHGKQSLYILLGAADGFSDEERRLLSSKSCLFWSLGAQTLPHDLAAVVASEQVYRALTIIKGEPYHLGHL